MALLCAQRGAAAAPGHGSTHSVDGKPQALSPAHHRENKPHSSAAKPHSCSREPKTSSVLSSQGEPAGSEPPVLQHGLKTPTQGTKIQLSLSMWCQGMCRMLLAMGIIRGFSYGTAPGDVEAELTSL